MTYFCKTKCFYRSKLWSPGETLEAKDGEVVPEHFSKEKPVQKPLPKGDPRTFSEMNPSGPVDTMPQGPTALSELGKKKK